MSKSTLTPSKNGKSAKSGKAIVLPTDLTPAVVHAVLEDAVLTAAAEEAVLETVLLKSDLEGIPYLGAPRRLALALAGFHTREDLHRASAEQIGVVKGVGMVNATRVKDWLATQIPAPPAVSVSIDPALAASNQEVQDIFQKLGSAAARLKKNLPAKTRDKALDRQLDKLDTVASELVEGPDTLSAKQVQEAVKTLDKIAALLESAASAEKLSPKKQSVLIEELRARRKRLQKTLGD